MYEKDIVSDSLEASTRWALFAARWALATVFVLIIIKSYAYYITSSVGIMGTLVDSFGDAAMSLVMLSAIIWAAKPADEDHRYGHGKAEGLAALFQGAILAGGAFFLMLQSLGRFLEPRVVENHWWGVGVAVIAIIMSVIVVSVQNYALKRTGSLAVTADRSHYQSDVFLNSGVVIGLLVNYFGGPLWVDALTGLCIASYIAWTAYQVGIQASDMLMDKELSDEVRLDITRIIESHPGVFGMHDLRTRSAGQYIHISCDIEVEPDMSLRAAHEITRDIEGLLLDKYPNADIIIHKDPIGDIYDARHRVQGIHH